MELRSNELKIDKSQKYVYLPARFLQDQYPKAVAPILGILAIRNTIPVNNRSCPVNILFVSMRYPFILLYSTKYKPN